MPFSSTTPGASGQGSRVPLIRTPGCFLLRLLSATSESPAGNSGRPGINMAWANIFFRRLHVGHYVFAFVFLIRLLALTRLTSSPFLFPSVGDMHFYDDWARQILQGRFTDHLAFYGLPLYAYFLAFLYKLFGYNPFVPSLLQICLRRRNGNAALQDRG